MRGVDLDVLKCILTIQWTKSKDGDEDDGLFNKVTSLETDLGYAFTAYTEVSGIIDGPVP